MLKILFSTIYCVFIKIIKLIYNFTFCEKRYCGIAPDGTRVQKSEASDHQDQKNEDDNDVDNDDDNDNGYNDDDNNNDYNDVDNDNDYDYNDDDCDDYNYNYIQFSDISTS